MFAIYVIINVFFSMLLESLSWGAKIVHLMWFRLVSIFFKHYLTFFLVNMDSK